MISYILAVKYDPVENFICDEGDEKALQFAYDVFQ